MDSYEIKILSGDLAGKVRPLGYGSFILGRAPDTNIPIPEDPKVSSRHCEITIELAGTYIQDLNSRNGTYVNDERIAKPVRIQGGDIIRVGSTTLEFSRTTASDTPPESSVGHHDPFVAVDQEPPLSTCAPIASTVIPSQFPTLGSADTVQCRLNYVSDDGRSKLCWISLDQSMEIGRSEWTDYSFPDDIKMSGKHFRVTLRREGCVIEDLQSKHGTWVNGVRVDRCALLNGSKIQAGSTTFQVEIVGIEWSAPPANIPAAPQLASAAQNAASREKMAAVRSTLHSEIIRIQGKWGEEPSPVAWLERLLAQKGNVYLLLDLGRIEMESVDDEQGNANTLFDWLPYPASKATPHLFDLRSWQAWPAAVEEAWGSDAMMVLSTRTTMDELIAHLRKMLRGGLADDSEPEAIQGICWPSVLRSLLAVEAAGVAKEYFRVVDALWIEGADDPLTWEWIGKPLLLDPLCKSMSIRLRDPQEAKTESSPPPKGVS
jgi:pSer/pThr/pTyr-binding forkhead associated (FHA) protein